MSCAKDGIRTIASQSGCALGATRIIRAVSDPSLPPSGPRASHDAFYAPLALPPATPVSSRKKWLFGCGGTVLILAGGCFASIFSASRHATRVSTTVIQGQAAALAAGNAEHACGFNSARLQAVAPCERYVSWLATNAPWFAGSTVTQRGFFAQSGRMRIDVHSQGPRGGGDLRFVVVGSGDAWSIDGVFLILQPVGVH